MNKEQKEAAKKFFEPTGKMSVSWNDEFVQPKQTNYFPLIVATAIVIIGGFLMLSSRVHFVEKGGESEWCYKQAIKKIAK